MKHCEVCNSTYPTEFSTCPKDQAPLRSLTELTPGIIIRDKYEILERIGIGGMATVYKARHLTFNEIRAIKVVSNKLSDDENFLKRFKTEAIITRKLRHPNAVQLDDFDTTADGRPFIVMEYVQGRNLRSWIHDVGALPIARAFNIAKQVASALGAAHKLGIVHRDIKPDNIIAIPQPGATDGNQDLVKVFDFGIAKIRGTGTDPSSTATQPGMVVGTPQYVSPEQASGKIGDLIDGRSDLYSLGVVLYEMVTGHLPFKSDTPIGFLIHHIQTAPTPPLALRPPVHLPEGVLAVLMKALEKDRDKRFQTAEEMVEALNRPQILAQTAVLGSNSLHTPTAVPTHAPSVPLQPQRPATAFSQAAPIAAARTAAATPTSETVYQGDATVFGDKRSFRGPLPWTKIITVSAIMLALLLGVALLNNRSHSGRAGTDPTTTQDDARIKQDIEDAIANSDSLKQHKVNVTVHNADVTLSGRVDKPYLTEIAGGLARGVDGVKNVTNEIEVIEAPEQHEQVWRSEQRRQQRAAQQPSYSPPQRQTTQPRQAPTDPYVQNQVRQYIARGYRRIGMRDFQGASNAFQNALQLDPGNRAAQDGLRRAQLAQFGSGIFHR